MRLPYPVWNSVCLLLAFGLSGCQIDRPRIEVRNYAAWSGQDSGLIWTELAEAVVEETALAQSVPSDIEHFCPRYADLNQSARVRFWVGLLSAMVEHESDFDPATQFTESLIQDSQGRDVVSRGLLQLSVESARQDRYGCTIERELDLHEPAVNLTCGARILDAWVSRDDAIAGTANKRLGGARYWSTLWHTRDSLDQIRRFTRQLDGCVT